MSPTLSLTERAAIIEKHVKRAIGATVLRCEYQTRMEWDGAGKEILGDFVVLWENPDANYPDRRWGAHTGVIRHRNDDPVSRADIFWGHYDLEHEKAMAVYTEKLGRMPPLQWRKNNDSSNNTDSSNNNNDSFNTNNDRKG